MSLKHEVIAIVKDEKSLQNTVDDLWQEGFSLHEISVQGDPEQLEAALGEPYVNPTAIADNPKTPRKEPSMSEEFGWLLVFSFAIPLFIGMVLGTIFASGASAVSAAILQGLVGGAIIGAVIGIGIAFSIKMRHDKRIQQQIAKGGFVIWVHADSADKISKAKLILLQDGASNIHESITN